MKRIEKHSFEAVSLLTADNGLLKVTIVPAIGQPDWLIPSSLILEVIEYDERVWTYLWQQTSVSVFHLVPRNSAPDKIIVLEGNTDVHRVGLQTSGKLTELQVRISDLKDVALPKQYADNAALQSHKALSQSTDKADKTPAKTYHTSLDVPLDETTFDSEFSENLITSYLFQCVMLNEQVYLVPDLDKIAHHLVDLDS